MKNLLICGDSFAADWTVKYPGAIGWPIMLQNTFNVTNLAQAGCSEYRILKQLESVKLSRYDTIIVTHTSPYRLYVDRHPIHHADALHKNSDLIYTDLKDHAKTNTELTSIIHYFENYFDIEYAIHIHTLLCKEIEQLTNGYPVIHVNNIGWEGLYLFPNMISFTDVFQQHRGLVNHFDDAGNLIVYNTILSYL